MLSPFKLGTSQAKVSLGPFINVQPLYFFSVGWVQPYHVGGLLNCFSYQMKDVGGGVGGVN